MSAETKGISSQLYEESGKFGVLTSTIGLYIGAGLSIIMVISGMYLLFSKGTYTESVTAQVLESICTEIKNPDTNKVTQSCRTKVKYTINGTDYVNTVDTSSKYDVNSAIEISYNKSNPNDSVQKSNWRKIVGGTLLIVAVVIFISSYIQYYLATRSKFGASAIGVGTGLGFLSAPFRG